MEDETDQVFQEWNNNMTSKVSSSEHSFEHQEYHANMLCVLAVPRASVLVESYLRGAKGFKHPCHDQNKCPVTVHKLQDVYQPDIHTSFPHVRRP